MPQALQQRWRRTAKLVLDHPLQRHLCEGGGGDECDALPSLCFTFHCSVTCSQQAWHAGRTQGGPTSARKAKSDFTAVYVMGMGITLRSASMSFSALVHLASEFSVSLMV